MNADKLKKLNRLSKIRYHRCCKELAKDLADEIDIKFIQSCKLLLSKKK